MIVVALVLLPALWVLLFAMDHLEERLLHGPGPPRHARTQRHLRLVNGGRGTVGRKAAATPGRHRDAA
ncbi:hypothetical protein ACF1DY_09520 [Streptomyces albus]|uniref:hypothetical protein n=1 Tax=Streptomyces albus TaxID=1888 RepID=UPI0036F9873C